METMWNETCTHTYCLQTNYCLLLLHSKVQAEYGLIVVPTHYINNPKNDKEKLLKNAYKEYTAMLGWNDDMIAYHEGCVIRKARAIESSRRLLVSEKGTKTPGMQEGIQGLQGHMSAKWVQCCQYKKEQRRSQNLECF